MPKTMAVDRLSALPDDVLRHILYFVPAKEGASTAVLSRRWRSLWRTSGAVNLESSLIVNRGLYKKDVRAMSKAFFRGAEAALAAAHAGGPVRRLTLHVESDSTSYPGWFLTRRRIRAMLSNPATQHVEELRIGATVRFDEHGHWMWKHTEKAELYKLSFGALPSEALRVLHIINCRHLKPPRSSVTFPRLARLRLQGCIVSLDVMQRVVDAVPQLATLHLESFSFPQEEGAKKGPAIGLSCYQLRCLTVNTLVLENCKWPEEEGGLELEVLKLRYFVYKGLVHHCHRLSLKPHASTNLVQVDLHLTIDNHLTDQICIPFWQFIQCFNITKVLKLKLDFVIDFLANVDKMGQDELRNNNLFFRLEELELEGHYYEPVRETAAMALAHFLHCCPVVRHLRLKLKQWSTTLCFLTRPDVAQLDFDKSIDHFRRHKRSKISMNGGYDEYQNCDVSDIPTLSKHSFSCLQSHLRRVSLKFWMEHPNCFGVQLAKFFAEKAMVLEEMSIDDGSQKMCHHLNRKILKWIPSNPSKRKSLQAAIGSGESYSMEHPLRKHRRT